jgi:hypothetical protein
MTRARDDFWSRRKARVAAEHQADTVARVELTDAEERARLDALPDEDLLAELDLPDPDTMKMGDDFTGFLRKTVPERLRRRALRKLWTSNPVLACVDGLNDYDEDFNKCDVTGAAVKTAYQVGRGFIRDLAPLVADDAEADAVHDPAEMSLAQIEDAQGPQAVSVAHTGDTARAGTDAIPTQYRRNTASAGLAFAANDPALAFDDPASNSDDPASTFDGPASNSDDPDPAPLRRRMRFAFQDTPA